MWLCRGIPLCSIVFLFYMVDNTHQQGAASMQQGISFHHYAVTDQLKHRFDKLEELVKNNLVHMGENLSVLHNITNKLHVLDERFQKLEDNFTKALEEIHSKLDEFQYDHTIISDVSDYLSKVHTKINSLNTTDQNIKKIKKMLKKHVEEVKHNPTNSINLLENINQDTDEMEINLKNTANSESTFQKNTLNLLQNIEKNTKRAIQSTAISLKENADHIKRVQNDHSELLQNMHTAYIKTQEVLDPIIKQLSKVQTRLEPISQNISVTLSHVQTRLDFLEHNDKNLCEKSSVVKTSPFEEEKGSVLLLENNENSFQNNTLENNLNVDFFEGENKEPESVKTLLDDTRSLMISLTEMVQSINLLAQNNTELLPNNTETANYKSALEKITNTVFSLENKTDETITSQFSTFDVIQDIKQDINSVKFPLDAINTTVITFKENDECIEIIEDIQSSIIKLYPLMERLEVKSAQSSPTSP